MPKKYHIISQSVSGGEIPTFFSHHVLVEPGPPRAERVEADGLVPSVDRGDEAPRVVHHEVPVGAAEEVASHQVQHGGVVHKDLVAVVHAAHLFSQVGRVRKVQVFKNRKEKETPPPQKKALSTLKYTFLNA